MSTTYTESVKKLIAQMTVDEKLAQIGSYWMWDLLSDGILDHAKLADKLKEGIGQVTRLAGASTLNPTDSARTANQVQKFLREETRLGIPALIHEECCSGLMMLGGTQYPQMIGLASTFQPELAEEMTKAIRKQMLAIGARQGLAPVMDLGRDPRWGRTEETFGEDPLLASHFGMAYVRGLQGENLAEGVMATGKHFIAHSLSQGGLNCGPVHVGLNELYDVYMVPFQAAIRDANLATIMNSYPEVDGEVIAASRRILTDLLREKLGFDGLVVSDYDAIIMLHNYHYVAEDKGKAAALALNAGIDVELPTVTCYGSPLKAALEAGEINLELVDLAVERHLIKKYELGLFDDPFVPEGRTQELFETPENRALARKIAQKSMVLLKNDGMLPLSKEIGTLAVIGPNADSLRHLLGDYSYHAKIELRNLHEGESNTFTSPESKDLSSDEIRIVSVLEGVKGLVGGGTEVVYAPGCEVLSGDDSMIPEAVSLAEQADAVVLVLGDYSGLIPACTSGETRDSVDLRLPGVQEDLAKAVLATGKPVAVVLVTGRPYAIPWMEEQANAILEAWLPGEEGGNAIADVLFGEVNPAGRLPVSFPRSVGQVPLFYNHKPSGMFSNWYRDYVSEPVTPLYPFGYGLSYTQFTYRDLQITPQKAKSGEVVEVTFRVENTGEVAGEEVAQLYVRDVYASVPRPMKELKGYARVSLEPGEVKTITFHLPVDQLAFINTGLKLVLEPGKVLLMVGSSSDDIRLEGEFQISEGKELPLNERVFQGQVSVS